MEKSEELNSHFLNHSVLKFLSLSSQTWRHPLSVRFPLMHVWQIKNKKQFLPSDSRPLSPFIFAPTERTPVRLQVNPPRGQRGPPNLLIFAHFAAPFLACRRINAASSSLLPRKPYQTRAHSIKAAFDVLPASVRTLPPHSSFPSFSSWCVEIRGPGSSIIQAEGQRAKRGTSRKPSHLALSPLILALL